MEQNDSWLLSIIKNKRVNVSFILRSHNVDEYNYYYAWPFCSLSEEEYDALREYLLS